jgi:S-adenosylmethionine:tRNA ribosyltransferase-isomerase
MMLATPHTHFHRPPTSDATEPPEAHGVARDAVRLLVARPSGVSHARFACLPTPLPLLVLPTPLPLLVVTCA